MVTAALHQRAWRLKTYLSAMLVAATVVAFSLVGGGILGLRLPQVEQESIAEVNRDATELATRVEILLGSLESRMDLLSQTLQALPLQNANALLDRATGDGTAFRAIYLASSDGTVLAAGVASGLRLRRDDLLGSDLSANPLFRTLRATRQATWGDKYLSALSGTVTMGLGIPTGNDRVLLAEVPLAYVLSTVQLAAGQRASSIWLVDRFGEVVADTQGGKYVGTVNLLTSPVMQAAVKGTALPMTFDFQGHRFYSAAAHSKGLDWYFIGGMPAGLDNRTVRVAVIFVASGFLGVLLLVLLMAPFWASWLARPLHGIVLQAGQITRGETVSGQWPRGYIAEFNDLALDLEAMAATLQEREQKFLAIFNASPLPMSVTALHDRFVLLDVNEAWCLKFAHRREDVIGRTGADLGLYKTEGERNATGDRMAQENVAVETWMYASTGQAVLGQIHWRQARVGDVDLLVWVMVDVTEIRRIEGELRELNNELEARVERRTQALESLNEALSAAVANLQAAQTELVRSEKMAALGSLVAGVAHELNTPLGNSLMAVTALADDAKQFRVAMAQGLKRSALDSLMDSVEQATSIATRNLERAADLVTSFKQVAVDQTSSQRRHFELAEVVHEMVVSLRPSLSRTPYVIEVNVPSGLRLDSYPGPLEQVIGNLINNAVLHGFEGRAHGTIRIVGESGEGPSVILRVIDNGKGIPAELLGRIFDPFVTTKKGRGGTGLGLHISYNAVVNLLGGSLTVHSTEGEGATFVLRLPLVAPKVSGPAV